MYFAHDAAETCGYITTVRCDKLILSIPVALRKRYALKKQHLLYPNKFLQQLLSHNNLGYFHKNLRGYTTGNAFEQWSKPIDPEMIQSIGWNLTIEGVYDDFNALRGVL